MPWRDFATRQLSVGMWCVRIESPSHPDEFEFFYEGVKSLSFLSGSCDSACTSYRHSANFELFGLHHRCVLLWNVPLNEKVWTFDYIIVCIMFICSWCGALDGVSRGTLRGGLLTTMDSIPKPSHVATSRIHAGSASYAFKLDAISILMLPGLVVQWRGRIAFCGSLSWDSVGQDFWVGAQFWWPTVQ